MRFLGTTSLCSLLWYTLIGLFQSRAALEAEILVLRHQLNVLRRSCPKRVTLSSMDRLLLVGLYRLAPGMLDALKIISRRPCCAGTVPASAARPGRPRRMDRSRSAHRREKRRTNRARAGCVARDQRGLGQSAPAPARRAGRQWGGNGDCTPSAAPTTTSGLPSLYSGTAFT